MGSDSVEYHEHTVAGRGDDPVSAAADYYASRGETPMIWGGSGRGELGLDGEVDLVDYRAVFGPGGARHPASGERLVSCQRPGLELVVSPGKSVAELGVIGRAEDMHAICDAERDATMAYLDRLVSEKGGRRGRAAIATPTGGLIWAVSRHATSRAGDPQVHDHVLIANLVAMGDERGGWKGLYTALLRDHLHAATAVGRMAGAAKAVELGYGIVADDGPTGRLGGWAVAGIPEEVCELHSTRAAQIDLAVGPEGSYQARQIAARATRDRKAHEDVGDLMARWQQELADAGWPVPMVVARVGAAAASYQPSCVDLEELAGELLGPGGRLAGEKTFDRAAVIVAAAPYLHGLPVSILETAVEAVLAHPDAVPLPLVAGARDQVYAAACVLADEHTIAGLADTLTTAMGPQIDSGEAAAAVASVEERLGHRLTDAQRQVAENLLTDGCGLDLVVGIAGSGKTTTLSAVRAGFETAGYTVIGTATSGQAAKTLGEGAGMESRTVASLRWQLEHGRLALTDRHIVILDESGMTEDVDIARLLGAVSRAGAKLIVVGDDRQLSAVGPGGALGELVETHPERVYRLSDNLRQSDPAERVALGELRSGDVEAAVDWYASHDRLHDYRDTRRAGLAMGKAWAADVAGGAEVVMLAYKRADVELLNQIARTHWAQMGRLSGPELVADGGRAYRAGDRVITLAPGPRGAWVTSQTATVTHVDLGTGSLQAVTPDGHQLDMGAADIAADKLSWGYAMTAHRSQGATTDVAHVLADGGGRELGYVAMSRARRESHVYVVAPNPEDAARRLTWDWDDQRRQLWVTRQARQAEIDQLKAQRQKLIESIPADVSDRLAAVRAERAQVERSLADLATGTGDWRHTIIGDAYQQLEAARRAHQQTAERAGDRYLGLIALRRARRAEQAARTDLQTAESTWKTLSEPHQRRLRGRLDRLDADTDRLTAADQARTEFLNNHPDIYQQIRALDQQISDRLQPPAPRPAANPAVEAARLARIRAYQAAVAQPRQHHLEPSSPTISGPSIGL